MFLMLFNPKNKIRFPFVVSYRSSGGEVYNISKIFILFDHVLNSREHSAGFMKRWYYKENFDADHS